MLRSIKDMHGYRILAEDEEVGHVYDFYVDTSFWNVRYLVVKTGNWLQQDFVLLAPHTLEEPDWLAGVLPVQLTAQEIEASPHVDVSEPLTRHHETQLHTHYGWDYYWLTLQAAVLPGEMGGESRQDVDAQTAVRLARARELDEFGVLASDGDAGHVDDFLVSDEDWAIYYVAVHTGSWLGGKKVLLSTDWIEQVDGTHAKIRVDVPRHMLEESPAYNPGAPVERAYEEALYDYYNRPKYWL